jgi:hypothetical protein
VVASTLSETTKKSILLAQMQFYERHAPQTFQRKIDLYHLSLILYDRTLQISKP